MRSPPDDYRTAYLVRKALNGGTRNLPASTAEKLGRARRLALDALPDGPEGRFGPGAVLALSLFESKLRIGALALALLIGAAGSYYWHAFTLAEEHEEIDSLLLADELPPAAYIDRGFQQWQARASGFSSR